jgi:hypothetical protein
MGEFEGAAPSRSLFYHQTHVINELFKQSQERTIPMPGRKRARNDPKVVNSQHTDEEKGQQPGTADAENMEERSRTANPDPSRSGESLREGGVNEQQGEPPPGYFTVAPGKQQGGKR